MKSHFETALHLLDEFVEHKHQGNVSRAARALKVNPHTFSRWYKRERVPNSDDMGRILDQLGARLVLPCQETSREVVFVASGPGKAPFAVREEDVAGEVVPAGRYAAVMLVEEHEAGENAPARRGWHMVDMSDPSLAGRERLLAVRLDRSTIVMRPLLQPGDIVLVDLQDKAVAGGAGLWLVREPGGRCFVRRVKMEREQDSLRTLLTFFGENLREETPRVYDLERDYGNNIHDAVLGRALWGWCDLTGA